MRAVGGVSADQRLARQVTRQLGYRPLSLGLAAAVRDSAAAIGPVPGVLYPFPLVEYVISNPALTRHLDQIGPLLASLDAQATIGVKGLAAHPVAGPRRRHPMDRRCPPPRRAHPEIPAMHDAYVPALSACT